MHSADSPKRDLAGSAYAGGVLSLRDRNRTLLARQHLLERGSVPTVNLVEHLVGLQAQDNLPPYLSLAARVEAFDPHDLSTALQTGRLVRLVTMRGTLHALSADDAQLLRPWLQPALDQLSRANQLNAPARGVPVEDLAEAARAILAHGPLPVKELGDRLAERFPGVPATALGQVARDRLPLVQLPPRGLWRRSGGVVYQTLEACTGRGPAEPDPREVVRRYLRAFGPATAADMTAWSRMTRLGPVFASMADELVTVACDDGRTRYDVPDGVYADGGDPAPVRLLGVYDNLWLSHADRSHVVGEDARQLWMGRNGGLGSTVFVDGFMAGLWWWRDGRVETDLRVRVTRQQGAELAAEVERVTALLSVPEDT